MIFLVFIQNIIYDNKPFILGKYRVLISTEDYNKENINKDDLIFIDTENKINKNDIIAYKNNINEIMYGKVKDVDNKNTEIETKKKIITLNNESVLGIYEYKVKKVGGIIKYLRTLKGFLLSIGTIFIIMLILTELSKILLFIKKIFTKKY
jgi:hypothetical protein